MLSLQTLTTIEALLMSRSDPRWGEFILLGQVIGEVQLAKHALMQTRVQPAAPVTVSDGKSYAAMKAPGLLEPATPVGYKEAG